MALSPPAIEMEETGRYPVPVLVILKTLAADEAPTVTEAKSCPAAGEIEMPAAIPVPVRVTSRVMLDTARKVAYFIPIDVGRKVTATVQLAPGVRVGFRLAQGVGPPGARLNMAAWGPETDIEPTGRSVAPVFDMTNTCGVEALPTFTGGNS